MSGNEMIDALRDEVLDADSVSVSSAKALRVLNRALRFVERELLRYALWNPLQGSESFTTSADTRAYLLTATDILRIERMVRLDSQSREWQACSQIPVTLAREDYTFDDGKWKYYLTSATSAGIQEAQNYTINFAWDPGASVTFKVFYTTIPADIAANTTECALPPDYHDLVVARASIQLTGAEESQQAFAMQRYQELLMQMKRDARRGAGPAEIRQEW